MLSSNLNGVEWCILKIIFKVRKVQYMDLCDIWANISEMVHAMTNVSQGHCVLVEHLFLDRGTVRPRGLLFRYSICLLVYK